MAEQTGIAWTDHTFNPWIGCTKVSAACDHCYAEELMDHRHHRVQWGKDRSLTSASNWAQPLRWNRRAREAGVRRKVFCASLADVFDNQVDEDWRNRLWLLIKECDQLDWLLLTKRPQNIKKMLPIGVYTGKPWGDGWPNVWLGMTAENQPEFDRRWPFLASVPAAVHFVSYEPGLGPLSLADTHPLPDWVIVGGESGAHARPFDIQWARAIKDECRVGEVAFFMKQLGDAPVGHTSRAHHGTDPAEWPADLRVREFPVVTGQ